jgi:heme-degrading monooxygenase HmoA
MTEQYIAAYWKVRGGEEEEFSKRWRAFTNWAIESAPGALSFTLLRNTVDSQYFISHGRFTDPAALGAWWEMPEFDARYAHVRELCEDHVGGPQTLEAMLTPVS